MTTGCEKCDEKQKAMGDDRSLCDEHGLQYLWWCFQKAKDDYYTKKEEIYFKEKQNEHK